MLYCDYKLYHISNDLKVVEEMLRIRDAYLGGRTNAINLKEEFSNDTKGGYVNFCSLYPHVVKYENYPIGHPVHINGNFTLPISSFACSTKSCLILGTEDCNGKHLKLNYCYIVGLGLNCKFIDLLFKCSVIKFIKISSHLDFIVSEIIYNQTDTLTQRLMDLR